MFVYFAALNLSKLRISNFKGKLQDINATFITCHCMPKWLWQIPVFKFAAVFGRLFLLVSMMTSCCVLWPSAFWLLHPNSKSMFSCLLNQAKTCNTKAVEVKLPAKYWIYCSLRGVTMILLREGLAGVNITDGYLRAEPQSLEAKGSLGLSSHPLEAKGLEGEPLGNYLRSRGEPPPRTGEWRLLFFWRNILIFRHLFVIFAWLKGGL